MAAAHWPELRPPVEAALRRALERADPDDAAAFAEALRWAGSADPENPLALALAARAGAGLAAADERSRERLEALEAVLARPGAECEPAIALAAGRIVVDLLDLDPEDFEPEIAAYVAAGATPEALADLARETADPDLRTWARETLRGLGAPATSDALRAVREAAVGPPPEDPARDAVWVAAVSVLAEEAVALTLAVDAAEPGSPNGGGPEGEAD